MARLQHDYQQHLREVAVAAQEPTEINLRNPLFELPQYLELMHLLAKRKENAVDAKLKQYAQSAED